MVFHIAAILLASCEAKPKKKEPVTATHNIACESSLTERMGPGLDADNDVMHIHALVACYEKNGYDHCNEMGKEKGERIMHICESEVRGFIEDMASMGGNKQPAWLDNLFSKERNVRSGRSCSTSTRTRGSRTRSRISIPSVCFGFSSSLMSFFTALAQLVSGGGAVALNACTAGGTALGVCLFRVFVNNFLSLFASPFGNCFFFLLGLN